MKIAETWVLAYLLNSLWQVPLVFCAAWLAARIARSAGPKMEHRVWAAALLLQVVIPMCSFRIENAWRFAWNLISWMRGGSGTDGLVRIVLGPAHVSEAALLRLPPPVLWTLMTLYAGGTLYFAARFTWGAWTTEIIRKSAKVIELTDEWKSAMAKLDCALQAKLNALHVATSHRITGPAMVGVRSSTLLLPPGFIERLREEDLRALLGHELAHMQRHDFAKNLLYGLVSLPVAYHPLLWLTRTNLAETRELVCDAAAANAAGGQGNYAHSLLRLAAILSGLCDLREPGIMHAVGIFDTNNFERRIMRLTEKQLSISGARKVLVTAACLVVAFSTCASTLAWRMDVNAPEQKTVKRIAVAEKYMTLTHQVDPVYPEEAKRDKLNGSVVLAVRVGKDGAVENLHVVKGPKVFQESALDAVKQWRYRPYLLNGNPIEVDTQVTVAFESK